MFKLKTQHFLTGTELSQEELHDLLFQAEVLREERLKNKTRELLKDKSLILLFEKPSLRTRVSFTVAIQELGGHVMELTQAQRKNEEPEDTLRVLQGYAHGLMMRTFDHANLERMQKVSHIPLINGLSDTHHPCQALADLQTLMQTYKSLKGVKLTYVGDGNNVLHSLMLLAPFMGVDLHYACPEGYQPDARILEESLQRASRGGGKITAHQSAVEAVKGTQAVYTDVWASMGQEKESETRIQAFKNYALTEELYSHAATGALIMHCMPMIRDQEIASSLVEHKCSALFRQSENRLHAQKALLVGLYA